MNILAVGPEILAAINLLGKVKDAIMLAEDAIATAQKFAPAVISAGQVLSGQITGQAALDDITAKMADIDAHFAHMEQEAAKLGT